MIYTPFRNSSLKILAIGLALVLWISVVDERVIERGLEVPVEFEHIPSTLEITGHPPDTVRVRLRGAAGLMSSLQPGDVVAVLDLSDEGPGQYLFDLFIDQVQTPSGVEVTSIFPETIKLTLDRSGSAR